MKNFLLHRVRLTIYFWVFLGIFGVIALTLSRRTFTSGALALFSVNSFLYGFYIAPILGAQKARTEDLHRIVRAEANAMFAMAIETKKLPAALRNKLQEMLMVYLKAVARQRRAAGGEKEYEALISYCLAYEGPEAAEVEQLLDRLVTNQQNRTNFTMQMNNPVFVNEWSIMLVLFFITISFVIQIDAGDSPVFRLLAALLCTGLSMLMVILVKLSTLTHKKTKSMWDPYRKLIRSQFYKIDG